MAHTDLSKMPIKELKALRKDVDKAIQNYENQKLSDARAAIEAAAKEHGFSLNEILGGKIAFKKQREPRYQNPEDPSQTWSGLGRHPIWVKEMVAAGSTLDDLLIKSP